MRARPRAIQDEGLKGRKKLAEWVHLTNPYAGLERMDLASDLGAEEASYFRAMGIATPIDIQHLVFRFCQQA